MFYDVAMNFVIGTILMVAGSYVFKNDIAKTIEGMLE